jgi:hypothetical protein
MIKKHTVGFGAIIGLVIGIVMAAAGCWLPANSTLADIFGVIHWPMGQAVVWIQHAYHASHGWSPSTDFCKWLMAYMGYWTLLGVLVGVGCRLIIGRRSSHAA